MNEKTELEILDALDTDSAVRKASANYVKKMKEGVSDDEQQELFSGVADTIGDYLIRTNPSHYEENKIDLAFDSARLACVYTLAYAMF